MPAAQRSCSKFVERGSLIARDGFLYGGKEVAARQLSPGENGYFQKDNGKKNPTAADQVVGEEKKTDQSRESRFRVGHKNHKGKKVQRNHKEKGPRRMRENARLAVSDMKEIWPESSATERGQKRKRPQNWGKQGCQEVKSNEQGGGGPKDQKTWGHSPP